MWDSMIQNNTKEPGPVQRAQTNDVEVRQQVPTASGNDKEVGQSSNDVQKAEIDTGAVWGSFFHVQ